MATAMATNTATIKDRIANEAVQKADCAGPAVGVLIVSRPGPGSN